MFNKFGSQSAAWSIHNKQDYDMAGKYILGSRTMDFRQDLETSLFKCRICPVKSVGSNWMPRNKLYSHAENKSHLRIRNERKLKSAAKASQIPSTSGSTLDGTAGSAAAASTLDAASTPHQPHQHCTHVHSPNMTDLSPDPMVAKSQALPLEFMPESRSPPAPRDNPNPPNKSQEFSDLGWTDATGRRVFFSAGDGSADQDPLAESLARALRGAGTEETVAEATYRHDTNKEDPLFCPGTEDSDVTAKELNNKLFGPDAKSEWFPYPDKAAFLTDVLFSSPRLRFSRAQQQAVLSWAKDLGATAPSYHKFRQTQEMLLNELGDLTKRQESGRGNVWYLNEISDSIKKDMANPFTRAGMTLYPEDAGNKLGEVWHGDKMLRNVPDHLLSPTIRHNGVIWYVNELVQCFDGSWFLPKRWVTQSGGNVMLASGFKVVELPDGSLLVQETSFETIKVSSFEFNFFQILDRTSGIYPLSAESDGFAQEMPHPLREKAGERMVYSIPLAVFIDDVSGNQSKQWNKHFSCYMSNGALPRTKLENEFHVRFVATSTFVSPLEIMQGVRASIEDAFTEPIVAWDCEQKEEVLLRPYGLLFAGDNPMQAELCSCAGLNTNYFCRTCQAGGTREWKQSNDGFAEALKAGELRNPSETAEETFQQILTALEPNIATTLAEAVRLSGVKDALAQPIIDILVKMGQDLRKTNPEGSSYSPDEIQTILTEELKKHQQKGEGITNPLFDMDGIDMHKDTPTEILHTVLLGVVKYYWGQTVWLLEISKDFALFQTRLNSILADGLNIPKIQADYMCQYKGGLIGKHFKTLSQIMAFAVEGLVPQNVLEAWLILGRLTVLLWHTEIENIDSYTAELDVCISDFINITCKCSPSILISKPKFHFLLHLPFFIRRFGPAVLFSTERYEAYNAVFRACSIYSNHLTPSRNIAWSFAGIDRVKHIVTGGWWKDAWSQKWTCASPRVMQHILNHPEMAAMVGLPTKAVYKAGFVIPYPQREPGEEILEHMTAKGLVSCSGDKAFIGQNIILRQEGGQYSPLSFGTIREILLPIVPAGNDPSSAVARITVQPFRIETKLHSSLHMPVVVRTSQLVVVLPEVYSVVSFPLAVTHALQDIECLVNLQHDCHFGKCGPHDSVSVAVLQECETTSITRARIHHSDDHRFIVNLASLHNYRQISSAIPASVGKHVFTVEDAVGLRASAAAQIRDKIAGNSDDPMSLPSQVLDSEVPSSGGVINNENLAEPVDEDPDRDLQPESTAAVVLAAPAFTRVGAGPRARTQLAKQAPITLIFADRLTNLYPAGRQSSWTVFGKRGASFRQT
ncbi:hypothetical protein B0H15DRAFT_807270 [Mycena belliarum]|uniref:Uncharacterized protein n=1 Tax=Mycena belliarum TaxID=1033014 RepID=A0AAD6TLD8_9AGAR|nr:hypothetical protein B0H15DRAFT_807270 [Mycena belliae]